jgi:hypothetical protein
MSSAYHFHRGLTARLRDAMRSAGSAVDEEAAQLLLAGEGTAGEPLAEWIINLRQQVLSTENRFELMRVWEEAHPGQDAFGKPFVERVGDLVKQLVEAFGEDEINVGALSVLDRLRAAIDHEKNIRDYL